MLSRGTKRNRLYTASYFFHQSSEIEMFQAIAREFNVQFSALEKATFLLLQSCVRE